MLSNIDIIKIIKNELGLSITQRGKNFFILCPFHNDKNPSLSFDSVRKKFYCFGCGFKAPDIFFFWSKFKKISIEESYDEISFLGYPVSSSEIIKKKKEEEEVPNSYLVNSVVSDIYNINLKTSIGDKVLYYLLKERKILESSIEKFSLGCSLTSNQLSMIFYKSKNGLFNLKSLLDNGLVRLNSNFSGNISVIGMRDYFPYGSLIIPLIENGFIISFVSRKININKIKDNSNNFVSENKYLYLPNNENFKKSNFIYNYSNVLSKDLEEVYLTEGFFDVISMYEKGIENCIAILGTNISDFQLNKISSLNKRIVIFPDGDDPGISFAVKLCKIFLINQIDCEVVNNFYKKDPDEICHFYENKKIFEIVNNRINPYDFIISHYFNELGIDKNPQRINNFLFKISSIFDSFSFLIRYFVINKLSELLKIEKGQIEKIFFRSIFLPIVHFNVVLISYFKKIIFSIEKKIINLISSEKRNFLILFSFDYKFFFPENQKEYYLIFISYYPFENIIDNFLESIKNNHSKKDDYRQFNIFNFMNKIVHESEQAKKFLFLNDLN